MAKAIEVGKSYEGRTIRLIQVCYSYLRTVNCYIANLLKSSNLSYIKSQLSYLTFISHFTFVLLSLCRYLSWWTIRTRVYQPPSSQCFYHFTDISAGGLLERECISRPVVSVLILTWLIRYIYNLNPQILNNVIKIKVLILQI